MYVNDNYNTAGITGMARWEQVGYSVKLPDDHVDVIAFQNKPEPEKELTAEELYTMLETKGTLRSADRPRPKRSNG